jgi:diguanylate cyclase (GGDEF)-like protein/PAS domain S-box-containing protein
MPKLLSLVLSPPEDSLLYIGHFDPVLVGLSVAAAIFSSYAALLASQQVRASQSREIRNLWIAVGGLCLGAGIWAMHFVGMLAFSLPCATSYDAKLTLLSTLPGILAGIFAVQLVSRSDLSVRELLVGGALIGAGIGAMHYSGMAAMRLEGLIRYDARLFVLSILVAVALATLALWIKLRAESWPAERMAWATPVSALVMGLAVSGMHYTAMAATYFVRDETNSVAAAGLTQSFLVAIVLGAISLIVVATIIATYLGSHTLSSFRHTNRLMVAFLAGWALVAWVSADYYYLHRARTYYEQEIDVARQQVAQIANGLDGDIRLLKGISTMVSRDENTQRILRRFGPDAMPSTLGHGERKGRWTHDNALGKHSAELATLADDLVANEVFLVNAAGDCVAASNYKESTSFVGTNYANRDYFRQVRTGQYGHQYAMGRVSRMPGIFHATPVMDRQRFVGAVVVKRDLAGIQRWTNSSTAFLADPDGVIVLAADPRMAFRAMPGAAVAALSPEKRRARYSQESLQPLAIESWGDSRFGAAVTIDGGSEPVMLASRTLSESGITVYVPRSLGELQRFAMERNWFFVLLAAAGGMLILAVSTIVHSVRDSQAKAADLRIAATAFESLEGITITDPKGVILRVNRTFSEITGYSAEEATGQTLRILKSGRQTPAFYAEMWSSILATGSWQGEIWNRRKSGEIYPEWLSITAVKGPGGRVTNYVGTFSDITQRKTAEDEIRHLAFYDHLTQLPNRRLMLDRLGRALTSSARHGRHGALMLIDLDNFKTLNDTLGHAVGDQLLIEAAARLKSSVREGDTVARLGGDEFVVILEDLDEGAYAAVQTEYVAHKILTQLSQPYQLVVALEAEGPDTRSHACTSSIGITLFLGNPISVDELMKRADTAMYQAKAAGRDTLRFFDPAMQEAVKSRADLEVDLRKAVFEDQLVLYYQAQVDASGRVIGAEALIRWRHPQRGLVPPGEFIPLAEETGLILPLGHWVLHQACTQLAAWALQPDKAHLTLAVNISARQFSLPTLVEEVLALIDDTGAPPHKLKLELTESLLLENAEEIIAKMIALKAKGVGFSMDDFGTGYSSLSYLKRLPLDQLKIDQSFVQDIISNVNDAVIARTIVALGRSLGLSVIAEGVETEAQRDFLSESGCHAYQGYFFSRPIPLQAFEDFVSGTP